MAIDSFCKWIIVKDRAMLKNKIIPVLSIPLAVLVIIVSLVGLCSPGFYSAETTNWRLQTRGQDIIDLFIVIPCLLLSALFSYRNNKVAVAIWGGTVFYLAYSFTIYCFNIRFNRLFIVYCLCLGLPVYSTIYAVMTAYKKEFIFRAGRNSSSFYITIYFILVAALFYFLWLGEIIPANLQNTIPDSLEQTGLASNGVYVLDLSIVLPAIIITGVSLLKGKIIGFILTPVLLIFFVLMDITIGFLQYLMKIEGLTEGLGVMYAMLSLSLVSMALLVFFYRDNKARPA
jgi:hypothetical protein